MMCHQLDYCSKDLSWEILDMDRVNAIIVFNGKFYISEINHQQCLKQACKEEFKHLDINTAAGLEQAIEYTDKAFCNGTMHGFDLYEDLEHRYLISHYPQTLENEKIYRLMKHYAEATECELGTFTAREKLGNEIRLIK